MVMHICCKFKLIIWKPSSSIGHNKDLLAKAYFWTSCFCNNYLLLKQKIIYVIWHLNYLGFNPLRNLFSELLFLPLLLFYLYALFYCWFQEKKQKMAVMADVGIPPQIIWLREKRGGKRVRNRYTWEVLSWKMQYQT